MPNDVAPPDPIPAEEPGYPPGVDDDVDSVLELAHQDAREQGELATMAARIERIDERERMLGKALRDAVRALGPLVQDLPASEVFLLAPAAVEAWQVIRDQDPETFLVYVSAVRQKCGHVVAQLVQQRIGAPGAAHAAKEIRLLTPAEVRSRPPQLELVRGVLPAVGKAAIVGLPGSGKSFLAFDLACAVASALGRWFGQRAGEGPSVYIGVESTATARLSAYERYHGRDLDQAALRIIEQQLDLFHPEADIRALLAQLAALRAEAGTIPLTVIDTMNRTAPGMKENAPEDMGRYLSHADRIVDASGGLVAMVHHVGKNPDAGARGHSSFFGALDCEITVKADANGYRSFTTTKQRDGASGAEFGFRLEVVDLGPHPDPRADQGERLSSCVVLPCEARPATAAPRLTGLGKHQDAALKALRTLYARARRNLETAGRDPSAALILTEGWRNDPAVKKIPRQRWYDVVKDLEERQLIAIDGVHVMLTEVTP